MYLALGEPMQKRNYYRAGWIRFENDADMEKVLAELSERKVRLITVHPLVRLADQRCID